MRILILAALVWTSIVAGVQAQQATQQALPELKSTKEKGSYGLGVNFGRDLRRAGFDLDLALLFRGITDSLSGAKPALSPQEIQESRVAFQQESTAKLAAQNKADAAAFLAQNKTKEGVVTLPSGLQYEVISEVKEKDAASPKASDTVTTHYRGTLLDGTVFDSSYDRGEPAKFVVNQVIAGWTEALQKMKVGDKWQLFIPSELAYKERGTPGGEIGPNAMLVFEVELLAVEPAK